MGKKLFLITIGLLLPIFESGVCEAGNFYVNGNANLVWLQDSDLTENGVTHEATFNAGFGFGGGGGYDFDFLRVEGEIAYRKNDINKVSTALYGNAGGSGDLSALSFMLNGFYDFKNRTFITPYIGGGIGVALLELSTVTAETIRISGGDDTVFAYQLEAGFNNAITESMSFDLGYRYFATTDPSVGETDAQYKSHNVVIRFRYVF